MFAVLIVSALGMRYGSLGITALSESDQSLLGNSIQVQLLYYASVRISFQCRYENCADKKGIPQELEDDKLCLMNTVRRLRVCFAVSALVLVTTALAQSGTNARLSLKAST